MSSASKLAGCGAPTVPRDRAAGAPALSCAQLRRALCIGASIGALPRALSIAAETLRSIAKVTPRSMTR